MKAVLALLVMALAPFHVSLGPMSLPVLVLLAALEAAAAAGGIWLAARIIRESRPRRLAGGAW